MKEFGVSLAKLFLSVVLVIGVFSFVMVFTASQELDESVIDILLVDLVSERIDAKIADYTEGYTVEVGNLYQNLTIECRGRGVVLLGSDIEIVCDELEKIDPSGMEEFLRERLSETVRSEVEREVHESEIYKLFVIFQGIMVGIVGISLVIIIILFFINVPKYKFLYNLGIVGMLAGAPFLLIGLVKDSIDLEKVGLLRPLVEAFFDGAFINLFYVLITGALIFGLGTLLEGANKNNKGKKKNGR